MKFYFFGRDDHIDKLIENKFSGILYTYNAEQHDQFTLACRRMNKDEDFKYMVAVRPYAISPQYLGMIFSSFNHIAKDKLQVNLISGHIKDNEKDTGGIVGFPNDQSSKIDRSEYLIQYINVLNDLNTKISKRSRPTVDFYVSTTNEFVYNAAKKKKNKMIIAYEHYVGKNFDIKNNSVMISMGPVIRDTQEELDLIEKEDRFTRTNDTIYCTEEELKDILNELKRNNVEEVLFFVWPLEEEKRLLNFVKQYKIENGEN